MIYKNWPFILKNVTNFKVTNYKEQKANMQDTALVITEKVIKDLL